ncbi:2-dehydropantoate 2-reductase [Natronospirillum operosum]|uniref:2-dehydropantoate 2-reductase n=1 Tax=Natronospirillum operosum TaxID=2759953 RepID=A0A4Z0WA27_9GAMM|nr:2-dehydropantoate 2-reductase [Natronospirillum operosum]TGG95002.1 2-dehydropantoate 2-reductase [Natronospirillum operosum]
MQIDIIGPGAIGLHCALSLPDDCLVRLRHPAGRGEQLTLSDDTGRCRDCNLLALNDPAPITAAIVTTKAGQVAAAVQACLPLLSAQAEVLLLHNGLGPQDEVAGWLGPQQHLYAGITTEGALRLERGRIRHTGRGQTRVGPWREPLPPGPLIQALRRSTLQAQWLPTPAAVRTALWQKLIINCAINPLTALHDLPNGGLAEPELRQQWVGLVQLGVRIAVAEGMALDAGDMIRQVEAVIRATARNYSSMHQDLHHGRSTEVNAILGPLIERGLYHGIDTDSLRALQDRLAKAGA